MKRERETNGIVENERTRDTKYNTHLKAGTNCRWNFWDLTMSPPIAGAATAEGS